MIREGADELLDKQRHAFRPFGDRPPFGVRQDQPEPRGGFHRELQRRAVVQGRDRSVDDMGQNPGIGIAIGDDQQHPPGWRGSRDLVEQFDGGWIGPVQVLHQDQQRPVVGGPDQNVGQGIQDAASDLFGGARCFRGGAQQGGEHGAGHFLIQSQADGVARGAGADFIGEGRGLHADHLAQPVDHGLQGSVPGGRGAEQVDDLGLVWRRGMQQGGQQVGFADAGVTGQQQGLPGAVAGGMPTLQYVLKKRFPTGQQRATADEAPHQPAQGIAGAGIGQDMGRSDREWQVHVGGVDRVGNEAVAQQGQGSLSDDHPIAAGELLQARGDVRGGTNHRRMLDFGPRRVGGRQVAHQHPTGLDRQARGDGCRVDATAHAGRDVQGAENGGYGVLSGRGGPAEEDQHPIADDAGDIAAMTAGPIEYDFTVAAQDRRETLRLHPELMTGRIDHVAEHDGQQAVFRLGFPITWHSASR